MKTAAVWSATIRPSASATTRSAVLASAPASRPVSRTAPPHGRVAAHERVHPGGFARRQVAYRVVQDERVWVGQQRHCEGQPAVHAERVRAEPPVGHLSEADGFEQVVGACDAQAMGGAEHPQVAACRPARMPGDIAEHGAHGPGRSRQFVQRAAVDERGASAGLEAEQQADGGGLARPGRAEQAGDFARADVEGEVGDSGRCAAAGLAGQSDGLDHPSTITPEMG